MDPEVSIEVPLPATPQRDDDEAVSGAEAGEQEWETDDEGTSTWRTTQRSARRLLLRMARYGSHVEIGF